MVCVFYYCRTIRDCRIFILWSGIWKLKWHRNLCDLIQATADKSPELTVTVTVRRSQSCFGDYMSLYGEVNVVESSDVLWSTDHPFRSPSIVLVVHEELSGTLNDEYGKQDISAGRPKIQELWPYTKTSLNFQIKVVLIKSGDNF